MDPDVLLKRVKFFDFDSSKNKFVADNVNSLDRELTFKELITLVDQFDFDSSKVEVVNTLRGHYDEYSDIELSELMAVLDFDSTKEKMLELLDVEGAKVAGSSSSNSPLVSVISKKSSEKITLTIQCDGSVCEKKYMTD
ncbi:hypothetical protein BOO24_20845 [Vibrio navarrensis]|nr:hypothetical protein [Vibrio navarrensis]MBE4594775.1 hypothetical protein [Vibrio navarrensis]